MAEQDLADEGLRHLPAEGLLGQLVSVLLFDMGPACASDPWLGNRVSSGDIQWRQEKEEDGRGHSSARQLSPGVSDHLIIAALFINVLINAIFLGNCLARGTECAS